MLSPMEIITIAMQSLGLGCILWAVECFRDPTKKNKITKTANKFGNIFAGILLIISGFFLFYLFGLFFIFAEFPTGENLPVWTLPISISITAYLYFFLPKTKLWKNRGKAKQPLEDGTNFIFRMIGSGIMIIGAGHILLAIVIWLKNGVWTQIALGDWLSLDRFDTGWWAINKVLNYILLDSSAALPLVVIGYIIYINSKDD